MQMNEMIFTINHVCKYKINENDQREEAMRFLFLMIKQMTLLSPPSKWRSRHYHKAKKNSKTSTRSLDSSHPPIFLFQLLLMASKESNVSWILKPTFRQPQQKIDDLFQPLASDLQSHMEKKYQTPWCTNQCTSNLHWMSMVMHDVSKNHIYMYMRRHMNLS